MSTDVANSQTPRESVFQKPKGRIGFSLRSSHSRKGSGLENKVPLHETHQEKEARRLQTKADPSMAITEEQPSAVASGIQTTLAPIRAIQHRDKDGNPIREPDRSNPTRSRWERPLETIRSFEAAVDGSYSRRSSYIRNDTMNDMNGNRRSLYTTDPSVEAKARYRLSNHHSPSSPPTNGYVTPESVATSNSHHPGRTRYPRPELIHGQAIYTVPDVYESHETINSAIPSGSSAELNYSTDPSSENSSIDRINLAPRKDTIENYGFKGVYDHTAQRQSIIAVQNQHTPRQFNQNIQPFPELIMKDIPKIPIKLESSNDSPPNSTNGTRAPSRASSLKLKSWIGRRFSRTS
ncbi:hypothetical protein K3495_g5872 [Podosphaera aphanis]|nr:hypothetical protein K3495_g5872 [Podosphaera aphanis]